MGDPGSVDVDEEPPGTVHYHTWGQDHDYAASHDPQDSLSDTSMMDSPTLQRSPEPERAEGEGGFEMEVPPSPQTPGGTTRASSRGSSSSITNNNINHTTRSTRSQNNPEFVAKQKSFMAKYQAATSGIDDSLLISGRPETPNNKRKRENNSNGKKRKMLKTDNNGQVSFK